MAASATPDRAAGAGAPEALDAEAAAFVDAWRHFNRTTQRAKARRFDDGPLSLTQAMLLSGLLEQPELTVGTLAERAEVSKPTATRMLDGLERDGYVTRRPCTSDRRAVLISLTPEGETALQARWTAFCTRLEAVSRQLAPHERTAATALLRRLAELMEDF